LVLDLNLVLSYLDKEEIGENFGEALKRMGISHAPEGVDTAFVEMDDDDSSEVGLEEFEEWFTKQEVRKAFDGLMCMAGGRWTAKNWDWC
jgi:hypothetical protein